MLKTAPAVFAVGKEYQIMVPVTGESLMWVRVDDENYYDAANGIMRSMSGVHRMSVPMEVLDRAREYTICEKTLIERKPYFPTTGETEETVFAFRPVTADEPRAYMIADAHNLTEEPLAAAGVFGDIDFLIMNGDIPDHSGTAENFDTIYRLCAGATGGSIPVVFARGNHDCRGIFAERMTDYIPAQNGRTYFTFRLGNVWGLVLDCGEDKRDSSEEYGYTVACHPFRLEQTRFLRELAAHAAEEYGAPGVKNRIVVVHNPFTQRNKSEKFAIEGELYAEWASVLRGTVKPDLMLCGHLHELAFHPVGCPEDHLGQPCPVVVGSDRKEGYSAGTGFVFGEHAIEAVFTDSTGAELGRQSFEKNMR